MKSTAERMAAVTRKLCLVIFLGFAVLGLYSAPDQKSARSPTRLADSGTLQQVNVNGFGDRHNSIAWSMTWWRGKLYVGTFRASGCTHVLQWGMQYPPTDPDLVCPPDPADIPLQAEIWAYTPQGGIWQRVYQAPLTPLPGRAGKYIGRDIGYRDMLVFREKDGVEALYVSGVSARFLYPGLPPPRLLRSTDGINFQPVPQVPGTVLGSTLANNFRSLAAHNGKLYVTAGAIWGDGLLMESEDPKLGNNAFRYVTAPDFRVFSVSVFNNQLYVGTTTIPEGYGVYRTDAAGNPPYRFIPVVTSGAYHPNIPYLEGHSVISMVVYRNQLYIGTDGAMDILRIRPDDTWDLIVGTPRSTPQGFRTPLSLLGARFGWGFNMLPWRMAVHNDKLFIATFDASSFQKDDAVRGPLLKPFMGAKLYVSKDGVRFANVAPNFFDGDHFNYGIRSFASTPDGLYIGTANDWFGTEIWKLQ